MEGAQTFLQHLGVGLQWRRFFLLPDETATLWHWILFGSHKQMSESKIIIIIKKNISVMRIKILNKESIGNTLYPHESFQLINLEVETPSNQNFIKFNNSRII